MHAEQRAVGGGDRVDDRQAEAVTVAVAVRAAPSRWKGSQALQLLGGTTGPSFATDRIAAAALVAVPTSMRPPALLWRIALSIRFAARRSRSCGSPRAGSVEGA